MPAVYDPDSVADALRNGSSKGHNRPQERGANRPALVSFRQAVENGLSSIADAVEKNQSPNVEPLVDEGGSEYVRLTIARFNELYSSSLSFDSGG